MKALSEGMNCTCKLSLCCQIRSFCKHLIQSGQSDGYDRLVNESHLVVNRRSMRDLLHFHFAQSVDVNEDLSQRREVIDTKLLFE